ncbi:hypothetical protein [Zunongwangia sp.]|uniref:hypothetical protein n=1 Tax=Zunongwangia sp. TaxID=1965325 RepID=UPI003AA80AD9
MKNYIKSIIACFSILFVISCEDDDSLESVDIAIPSDISAQFTVKQDNSGDVSIFPSANGANMFSVDFGDGSEVSEEFASGDHIEHTYAEGQYDVTIYAINLNGEVSEASQSLNVSFLAPENLEVTITKDSSNPFKISVTATAENAAGYEVYFGENTDEQPTLIMESETAEYEYGNIGDYTIRVIALSGGAETTEYSEEVTIVDPLLLPINFESQTVDYTFYNFGGGAATTTLVANPATNEVNESTTVASYTKPSGSETWAGTSATLNENIDFNSTTFIAVDVYSPKAGIPVLFKVENADNSDIFTQFEAITTKENEWETLIFDLSDIDPSQTYSVIALFFDYNTSGDDNTYYFDNIRLANPTIVELPVTFEGNANAYQFTEFNGAPTVLVANPDMSDGNPSENVVKVNKIADSDIWAGSYFDLDNAVDFTEDDQLSLKIWSPEANIPITLKFEDPNDGETATEASATVTEANTWQTLTFDFSGADASQNWKRAVLFMDAGNAGKGLDYYYDDLSYVSDQPTTAPKLPLTFESALVDYSWSGFGEANASVIENPDVSGINTSTNVTELVKNDGAKDWAGVSQLLSGAIDFSQGTTISMKTWSPKTGATILLKLENSKSEPDANGNPSVIAEVQQSTTVASEWEELSFDLTSFGAFDPNAGYDTVVVFYDFGNTEGGTFYFDDIQIKND